MKTTLSFILMLLLLLIPGTSAAQTDTKAVADATILPWLGIWTAMDETPAPGTTAIEIRPGAEDKGFEITTKGAEQTVSESIIPDGISRSVESNTCTGTSAYQLEKQTGIILGKSEMVCRGETYDILTLKMLTSADQMVDFLFIKTPDQTRLAVRRFAFETVSPAAGEIISARESLVLRMALAAPWDLDKIISLSKTVETVVLEAALLEKNLQVKLDTKSLKKMKSSGTPDSIIDLLVALSAPDKFKIEKNKLIAVETASTRSQNNDAYPYNYRTGPSYYGYGYGYYFPGNYYWSYYSPFWWGYPIYLYPGTSTGGGSGGGGGGTGSGAGSGGGVYSEGRLSSGSGYVQVTPRDTGHQAVPRGSVPTGGGGGYSAPAGGGGYSGYSAGSVGASSAGGYSGGGAGSGGASASPSGYSGGGGGTAVQRQ